MDISAKPGFYWAPAAMEKLYHIGLLKVPSPVYVPLPVAKKVPAGHKCSLYVLDGFNQRIIYSTRLNPKGSWYPGREILKEASFGLYNAQEKSFKASYFKEARNLGALCHRIQDSGGFQLFTGVTDFIDPVALTKVHDEFADSGVSLDLPLSLTRDVDTVRAGARMLAANSATLLKERKGSWNLMNVSHGLTPYLRAEWQKIALKEPLDSLCIAGLRGSIDNKALGANPVALAVHMLVGMLHPNDYRHYHLLGLSSTIGMFLAALIANLHQKVVTSDSTTYLNGQQFGHYIGGTLRPAQGNFARLSCSCPACAFTSYEYWMQDHPYLLSVHNAFAIQRQCETLNGLARMTLAQKLTAPQTVRLLFDSGIGINRIFQRSMLQAVDLLLNTTSYKAAIHVDYHAKGTKTNTLFGGVPAVPENNERQHKIIRSYESYHGKKFL